jgi:hypothetical protein
MTKRETYRFVFLCFSGALYHLMTILLPVQNGIGQITTLLVAPIILGISLISAALYFLLLKKTTYVFLTEFFSMIGIGIIIFTLMIFPYS